MKKAICLLVTALPVFPAIVQAEPTPAYEPPFTIERQEIRYDVHTDGTYEYDDFESIRINNEAGIKAVGQISVPVSTSLQSLEVLQAYTVTKDGKHIDVSPDKILNQQTPLSAAAPIFDDIKLKTVVFPALEAGATVNVHFKRIQKTALFPGEFSMLEKFDKTQTFKFAQLTVTAPDSMQLFVETKDLPGGEVKSEEPGKKIWRWSIENTSAVAPEPASVNAVDFSPRVAVTSFPSYDAIAKAYYDRAKSKARVTSAIRTLAHEITKGITDKRAQSEAIYNWVSLNIRYVGIFFDVGGVVPHDSESILAVRYGDCKDHATLLEALLAAKDIKSSPVLVNATNAYWLPDVAAPEPFNHLMSYLPQFDLFVDSTAQLAPFGVLAATELGKSALIVDDGSGHAKQVQLPQTQLGVRNTERSTTELKIAENGDISGQGKFENSGTLDLITRAIFVTIPKGAESQLAARSLSMTGQQGGGTFERGNPIDLNHPFNYSTQFTLPAYMQPQRSGALNIPAGIASMTGLDTMTRFIGTEKRVFPVPCGESLREETTSILFPSGVKIAELPKPVNLQTPLGSYQASYTASDQQVTVKRTLDLNLPAVCSGEQYSTLKGMLGEVSRDLRTQIAYQRD